MTEVERAEKALKDYGYSKDNQGVYFIRSQSPMWKKIDVKDQGGWAFFKLGPSGELIQAPYTIKVGGVKVDDPEAGGTLANPKVGSDVVYDWGWPDSVVAQIHEDGVASRSL